VLCLACGAFAQANHILNQGTEIKVRTDTAIPAKPAADQQYTATISNDVMNSSGSVAIPRGSRAVLVAVPTADGKDVDLDLRYVTVNGRRYLLAARSSGGNGKHEGLGVNRRTGMYVGGGAAIGGILGGLIGGGRGAGIGAILGGAGGAGAQVHENRRRQIPAETELTYKLAEDLQMRHSQQQ